MINILHRLKGLNGVDAHFYAIEEKRKPQTNSVAESPPCVRKEKTKSDCDHDVDEDDISQTVIVVSSCGTFKRGPSFQLCQGDSTLGLGFLKSFVGRIFPDLSAKKAKDEHFLERNGMKPRILRTWQVDMQSR